MPTFTILRPVHGSRCDVHETRYAVARIAGDDAYADEPYNVCQPCLEQLKNKRETQRQRPCKCDWCREMKTDVKPFRDRESARDQLTEMVCGDCRKAYIQKELTNDFIPGRRRTRAVKEQEEIDISEEAGIDNNDDDLTEEE